MNWKLSVPPLLSASVVPSDNSSSLNLQCRLPKLSFNENSHIEWRYNLGTPSSLSVNAGCSSKQFSACSVTKGNNTQILNEVCRWRGYCISDMLVVVMAIRLTTYYQLMGSYWFECALTHPGGRLVSNRVTNIHPAEMCVGNTKVIRVDETNQRYETFVTETKAVRWWPVSTICVWLRVEQTAEQSTLSLFSTQLIENTTRGEYTMSAKLADNYHNLKVTLKHAYTGERKTLSMFADVVHGWNVLMDTNWHLLCITYNISNTFASFLGYFDGRFVTEGKIKDESCGNITWIREPFEIASYGLGAGQRDILSASFYSFKVFNKRMTEREVDQLYHYYCGSWGDFNGILSGPLQTQTLHSRGLVLSEYLQETENPVQSRFLLTSPRKGLFVCSAQNLTPAPFLLWEVTNENDGDKIIIKNGIPGWKLSYYQPLETDAHSIKYTELRLKITINKNNQIQMLIHRFLHLKQLRCVIENHKSVYNTDERQLPNTSKIPLNFPFGASKISLTTKVVHKGLSTALYCVHDGTNPPPIVEIYFEQQLLKRVKDELRVVIYPTRLGNYSCHVTNGAGHYRKSSSLTVSVVKFVQKKSSGELTKITKDTDGVKVVETVDMTATMNRSLHAAIVLTAINIILLICGSLCCCIYLLWFNGRLRWLLAF